MKGKRKWLAILSVLVLACSLFAACANGGTYAISLDRSTAELTVGGQTTLVATLTLDGEEANAQVQWSSSDATVASVENGTVTALKAGQTTVTASAEGVSASCTVTVKNADFTLSLDRSELPLFVGENAQLTVTASDGKTHEYTWTSSNETVATVEGGNVTAVAVGTATITVSSAGVSATCAVTVEEEDVFLVLSHDSADLAVGGTLKLTASLTNGSPLPAEMSWTSSDDTVASVEEGTITAHKAGTAIITADAGEGLTATCTVTVSDVYELIFPELPASAFVGEEIDLGLILRKNGAEEDLSRAQISGEGFTVSEGKITPITSGQLSVTVTYQDQTRTQTFAAYIEVADKEGLAAVNDDLSAWYKLTADLDFEGGYLETIAHYSDGNTSATTGFLGVFDGNSHSIMNFTPVYNGAVGANCALFGWIGNTGVVRNLNVLNASLEGRISGGIANTNYGLIENCFAESTVNYQPAESDKNNPMGGICSKNYGDIANTVAVLHVGSVVTDTQCIGGFVGRHLSGSSMTNCYALTTLGFVESAVPTNGDMSGTLTNCGAYDELSALYENLDASVFAGWTLNEAAYPHLGTISAEIALQQTEYETFAGTSVSISAQSALPVNYALAESVEGVEIDGNTVHIGAAVPADTAVTVRVYNLYNPAAVKEVTVTVLANDYEVTAEVPSAEFTVVAGEEEGEWSKDLGIVVKLNGEEIFEGFEIVSTNPEVASVAGDVVTCVSDGTASVQVVVNDDTVMLSISVTCNVYQPVRTAEEFDAIRNDQSAKYILMNDIDFHGATFNAFSCWATAVDGSSTPQFTGIFDGNGYSLLNINPGAQMAGNNDWSIFGVIGKTGVVRNLSVIGAKISNRAGVISSYLIGTIENCYVEATITGTANANLNNPIGAIAEKTIGGSLIENCIAVVTVEDGVTTTFAGGIAGQLVGAMKNSYVVNVGGSLGVHDGSANSTGTTENCAPFADLAAFYNAETGADTESFGSIWVFNEGYYPHLDKMEDPFTIEADDTVYQNSTTEITLTNKYPVAFSLKEPVDGVSFEDGVLTVGKDVPVGTQITFVANSLYLPDATAEKTITVAENPYAVQIETETLTVTWIGGEDEEGNPYTPAEERTATAVYTVTENGELYEGEAVLTSQNSEIATVSGNVITAVGDGTANIVISVNGIELGTISFVSEMYRPVRTAEELDAVDADKASLSAKYVLMNDIDFEGGQLATIAHYGDGNTSATTGFLGVFDGNGYAIKNFTPVYNGAVGANCALFGWIGNTGVVRNLKVIGASLEGRISGGIASTSYGLIENCYVEVTVNYQPAASDRNNPMGGICSKNYGDIANTIAVLSLGSVVTDTQCIGGFVGRHLGGSSMTNCFAISSLGFTETAEPTNGDMNGTLTNCSAFADNDAFFAEGTGADLSAFNGGIWAFDAENKTISLKENCFNA